MLVKQKSAFMALFASLLFFYSNSFGYEHPGGMHSKAQISFVKKQIALKKQPYYDAFRQLITKADSSFKHEKHALADFAVPGYYVDALNHRKNSAGLQSDAFDAYACALAFQLTNERRYADKSLEYLMAWANLNTKYSEADGSLVMAYSGTALIMAGELLLPYKKWSNAERFKYFEWAQNVYLKACNEIRTKKNNWADWGRFGSLLCAHLLDNPIEMQENIKLIKSDIFDKIVEDGHMPFETQRGVNGIWYTYFSLAPMTASFYVVYNSTGENLFELREGEKSIKKALDYLYYYSLHPDEWPYFKNPNKSSPSSWPGNLLEAMYYVYGDERFSQYIENSRPLVYDKHHFAWSFPTLLPAMLKFPSR